MKPRPKPSIFSLALLVLFNIAQASAQPPSLIFLNNILGGAESETAKSTERLSGGRLLLTDDPASYAIFDSLAGQVRSLGATIRNSADMLSYYNLQDAVLGGIIDFVQRIRELLVQRSNGILGDDDRDIINGEIRQLYDQVTETLQEAEFNQKKLFLPSEAALSAGMFNENKYYELDSVDALLQFLIGERTTIGAQIETLGFTISGQGTESLNSASALSQGDTDFAKELTNLERSHILLLANILMLKRELR